jgi:ABC-type methionine transport system ATPase subunit
LTGRENVYLNGSILGLSRAEIGRKMESILDFAGVEEFIDTPVKRYSSGMQARLGFAVAAHVEPEVLLVDEVLSVGDYAFQQKCLRKMEEFRRSGTAIVFVSHNLNAIVSMCSHAIVLEHGRIAVSGTAQEAIAAYTRPSGEPSLASLGLPAEVAAARVLNATGVPTASFESGEEATVELRIRANSDVDEPVIGFALRNADGVVAYGTNTAVQRVQVGDLTSGSEVTVCFRVRLSLGAGSYSLTASVIPAEPGLRQDWREHLAEFEVFDDQRGTGIASLSTTAYVDRLSERGGAA